MLAVIGTYYLHKKDKTNNFPSLTSYRFGFKFVKTWTSIMSTSVLNFLPTFLLRHLMHKVTALRVINLQKAEYKNKISSQNNVKYSVHLKVMTDAQSRKTQQKTSNYLPSRHIHLKAFGIRVAPNKCLLSILWHITNLPSPPII